MKKHLFLLLFAIVASIGTMVASVTIDGIKYNLNETKQTADVTHGYQETYSGNIVIPSQVTYSGKTYHVTSIGEKAFGDCEGLTSIDIPNSVTSIGDYAFHGCVGLTSVTIPDGVLSIGQYAFCWCTSLKSVVVGINVRSVGMSAFVYCESLTTVTLNSIPMVSSSSYNCHARDIFGEQVPQYVLGDAITQIRDYFFSGCSGMTSITISSSVNRIGKNAFNGCSGLTSIEIPNSVGSIEYNAFTGCSNLISIVWNAKKTQDFSQNTASPFYNIREQIESFTFGNDVEGIPAHLCVGMKKLTSITIPHSVKSIGNAAFANCSSLTAVYISDIATWCAIAFNGSTSNPLDCAKHLYINNTEITDLIIPDGITSIGDYAFCRCSSLTSVSIPSSVTSIGAGTFSNCSGLTSVTIPSSVTSIGVGTFYNCSGLTSVEIPNSVTSIGENAFSQCKALTSITIPSGVTSIGYGAFGGCKSLTAVHISDIAAWCAIAFGNNLSNPLNDAKHLYLNGIEITNLVIPEGVTSIGDYAFYGCSGLTSVTIPNSAVNIGNCAFSTCSGLTSITCKAVNPPQLGEPVFDTKDYYTSYYLCEHLYVPAESVETYRNADGWKYFDYISAITDDAVEDVLSNDAQSTKVLRDGKVFILRGDKTYTVQGQEVK